MLELLLALLVSVGVIPSPVEAISAPNQITADRPDARPAYEEVECFVSCMDWCLWEGPPSVF